MNSMSDPHLSNLIRIKIRIKVIVSILMNKKSFNLNTMQIVFCYKVLEILCQYILNAMMTYEFLYFVLMGFLIQKATLGT